MTEHHWDPLRTRAIRQLAATPTVIAEQAIVEAFKDNPRHVTDVIEAVIAERAAGSNMTSPWAIIAYRLTSSVTEPVIAVDNRERDLRIRQAEAFTRNAGIYLDRPQELHSELFDEGGTLHPYRTPALEQRMEQLWQEQRPRGVASEQATEKRALERVALRSRLTAAKEAARPKLNPEPEADPEWHLMPEPELQETP